jgi:hypothetical protein
LAGKKRAASIDIAVKRAEFSALMSGIWEPTQGWALAWA